MELEFIKVKKEYKASDFSLDEISFKLDKKEVIGLIGQNGSGKSTILKMANQLVKQDAGQILFEGKDISSLSNKELQDIRKKIVYIFQSANLLDNKSVYYHLSLVYKLNNEKINDQEIDKILEFMNIDNLKNAYTRNLSGGQKQKVAIAMAILQRPKVILCDEISSALDTSAEKEIYDLLQKIVEDTDISILMVSHNLNVLKNFCHKILFIENGKINDVIIPNKSNNKFEDDYHKHVVEYLYD